MLSLYYYFKKTLILLRFGSQQRYNLVKLSVRTCNATQEEDSALYVVGRVDVRVTVGVELLYAIRSTVNQCQQRGSQVERLVHGHSRSISRSSKVDNDVTLDSAAEVQV